LRKKELSYFFPLDELFLKRRVRRVEKEEKERKKEKKDPRNLEKKHSSHVKQQERPHEEQRPPGPPRAPARVPVPLFPRPRRELRGDAPRLRERASPRRDTAPSVEQAPAPPLARAAPSLPRPQQRRRRHPELHPDQIAHGDVEHPPVPPALAEVGQRVRQGRLGELKAHRERPEQAPVAEEDRLGPPAQGVRDDELVEERGFEGCQVELVGGEEGKGGGEGGAVAARRRSGCLSSEKAAVPFVAPLRQGFPKLWVQQREGSPGPLGGLAKEPDQGEEVGYGGAWVFDLFLTEKRESVSFSPFFLSFLPLF